MKLKRNIENQETVRHHHRHPAQEKGNRKDEKKKVYQPKVSSMAPINGSMNRGIQKRKKVVQAECTTGN